MTNKNIIDDCIRYCIVKSKGNDVPAVLNKISKALHNCDMTKESIRECIVLLKILEDEMP